MIEEIEFEYEEESELQKEKEIYNKYQSEEYEIVQIQYENTKLGIVYKYILQVLLTISVHIWVFWYLPIQGNLNTQNTYTCEDSTKPCNEVLDNFYIIFFYIFYAAYLSISGIQIK